jgi:hypothetical protein
MLKSICVYREKNIQKKKNKMKVMECVFGL